MIILGIDPGYAITGYGVIEYQGNHFRLITSGAIETKKGVPFPKRLQKIFDDMMLLIETYHPDAIAVEELFFNNITINVAFKNINIDFIYISIASSKF